MNLEDIKRDKEGFLININDWNEEIAFLLAKEEDLNLEKESFKKKQLEVIKILREYFFEFNTNLTFRAFVNLIKKKLGSEKGNSIYLNSLFCEDPLIKATKIAGLPKPTICL